MGWLEREQRVLGRLGAGDIGRLLWMGRESQGRRFGCGAVLARGKAWGDQKHRDGEVCVGGGCRLWASTRNTVQRAGEEEQGRTTVLEAPDSG